EGAVGLAAVDEHAVLEAAIGELLAVEDDFGAVEFLAVDFFHRAKIEHPRARRDARGVGSKMAPWSPRCGFSWSLPSPPARRWPPTPRPRRSRGPPTHRTRPRARSWPSRPGPRWSGWSPATRSPSLLAAAARRSSSAATARASSS